VPVKLLTSMLTIGSGGSAGREGPVAQVGAGFGSYLADLLRLGYHDRRVLVVSGMAAGIGGMFRAPLGAALFAVEVLYSDPDFESEALIPAIISSIVSYVVVASLTGWDAIFHTAHVRFVRPQELLAYLVLGMVVAAVGYIYVKVFYGMRDRVFRPMPIPAWTKPAVGGLLLGLLALAVPQVLGGGYGWLQLTMDNELPLKILVLLLPAKILATSFTISSGGSGGVFAPSLVIGGVTGAIFADLTCCTPARATHRRLRAGWYGRVLCRCRQGADRLPHHGR
jgi:CIC family chloride channel protein